MALCMPFHLRQRTSRVYQDHLHFCRVLTSFVPPVHNQGVSLAPLQGLALWKIFLPTTGSFFVFSLTDLFLYDSRTGTLRRTFSRIIPLIFQLSCFVAVWPLCCLYLRSPDVTHHFLCVIINTFCQNCVENPQSLTGHRYH